MNVMQSRHIYVLIPSIIIYLYLPNSGGITWQPNSPQTVTAVKGSSAIFVWKIVFDNANNGIQRADVKTEEIKGGSFVTMLYKLKDSVNATVSPNFKSREKDLELVVSLNSSSNTATIKFILHNVNLTVDDGRKLRLFVALFPTFEPASSSDANLVVQVRVNNFKGPQDVNIMELKQFNVICSADGKPPAKLTLVFPNGDKITANEKLNVTRMAIRNMTGMYNCTAENEVSGPYSKSALLNVWYKPDESSVSYSRAVCVNKTIKFNCKADAFPAVTNYTFYQGTEMVHHSVDGNFSTKVSECGIQNFSCDAYNPIGSGRKALRQVNIFGDFNIDRKINNENRVSKTVNEKDQVTLQGKPSGCGPGYNITWKKTGQVIKNGIDEDSLKFDPINRNQEGVYEVIVHDELNCFTRSGNFQLTVNYKPESTSIDVMPNKSVFCYGSLIQINCTSRAKPPAVYSFYRNTLAQNGSSSGYISVTLNKVGNYRYTCVPSNAAGVGQNKSTEVFKVIGDFTIRGKINDEYTTVKEFKENDKVVLQCETSVSGPYNITWTKNHHFIKSQIDGYNLTFNRIQRNDEGLYEVTVRDELSCFTRNETFNLTVNYKPESTSIVILPSKNVFCIESEIRINCTTRAKPPAVYSLYRNNTLVQNGSSSGYFTVTLDKVGNYSYTCVPSNAAGVGQNQSLHLNVKVPPNITACYINGSLKTEDTVYEGDYVNLTCEVAGSPPLNVTYWRKNEIIGDSETVIIKSIKRSESGNYTITANNGNECRTAEETFHLTVYYQPDQLRLIYSKNKTNVNEGDDVNITCKAEANPEPYYLWTFNRKIIPSKVNDTVVLSNVAASDDGNYTCTAVNKLGQASITTNFVVNYFNRTCQYVHDRLAIEGDNITLNCYIPAHPPAEYKWDLKSPSGKVVHASVAHVKATPELDGKSFTCTATNQRGSINCSTTVNVYYKPRGVSIWSRNKAVNEFQTIYLNCTASSKPDYNCTWKVNGKPTENGNSCILTKYNVTRDDAGEYMCIVENEVGSAFNVTSIKVLYINATCEKVIAKVIEGNNKTLNCSVPAYPPASYTWNLGSAEVHSSIENQLLIIVKATSDLDGKSFICTASNPRGSINCTKTLKIYYKPRDVLIWSKNEVVNELQSIYLNCTASSKPAYNCTWKVNGKSTENGNSCKLTKYVTRDDAGEYMCIVENEVGSAFNVTSIKVLYFGNITCKDDRYEVNQGANISLYCNAQAYPPVNYTWNLGSEVVHTSSANLKATLAMDNKTFICNASNTLGSKYCTTKVTVNYFSCPENFTKSRELIQEAKSRQYEFVGDGRPKPNISCSIPEVIAKNDAIYVDKTVSRNFSCIINNTAGSCRANFGIWKQSAKEIKKQGSLMLIREWNDDLSNNSTAAFVKLRKQVHEALMGFYTESDIEYLKDINDIYFVKGSVWVNFELILIANVTDAFKPIREALEKNDGKVGELRFNKTSVREFSTKDETTTPGKDSTISLALIIGLALGAFLLLIILCVCYYRKKCIKKDDPLMEDGNGIPLNAANGRDNLGLASSSSVYVEKGPSPLDPANDSVRDNKDMNNKASQSAPSGDVYAQVNKTKKNAKAVEPMYAAADKSKKPKKNPEPFYADLGDFNKSGEQPKGSHGGIVLQPFPEGEKPKMPEKYEESEYASIDFSKIPPVDKQGGDESDILSNSHEESKPTGTTGQTGSAGTTGQTGSTSATGQAGSTSAKTDSGNPEEQKNVVGEEKNKVAMPGDNQATQPPTKEDSEQSYLQNQPADSLVSRSRNNTTLTTVSL